MSAKRKVRARKMWANAGNCKSSKSSILATKAKYYNNDERVFVLPADAESYDAIVEQMARATQRSTSRFWLIGNKRATWNKISARQRELFRQHCSAALASVGIHRPPTKEKK